MGKKAKDSEDSVSTWAQMQAKGEILPVLSLERELPEKGDKLQVKLMQSEPMQETMGEGDNEAVYDLMPVQRFIRDVPSPSGTEYIIMRKQGEDWSGIGKQLARFSLDPRQMLEIEVSSMEYKGKSGQRCYAVRKLVQ